MTDTMANRLKRLREAAGLGQAEVSAATGIDRSLVSKMENKGNVTDWYKMCALADLYNVSLDYLRSGSSASPRTADDFAKDDDERALLSAWRDITDEDRAALRVALRNAKIAADRAA